MQQTERKIKAFLSRFFNNQNLGDTEDIFAAGFVNSLLAIQLVSFLEKEFRVTIGDEDLDMANFRTVRNMASLIERKTSVPVSTESAG